MKIFLLGILILFITGAISVLAGEDGVVNITLIYPQKFNTAKKKTYPSTKPIIIRGTVLVTIDKNLTVLDVENERFLAEYFIDGESVYETNGANVQDESSPTFNWVLDTAQYSNGTHKLLVNLWDDGEGRAYAAIGVKNVIIDNPVED